MADVLGTVATAVASGGLDNAVLNGLIDGRLKCMLDSYTIAGTEVAGSTIKLGATLPKGANIVAILLNVSAAQTSLTANVGDTVLATRYATASTGLQSAGLTIIGGLNYVVAATGTTILITTAAATASAATLTAAVVYAMD